MTHNERILSAAKGGLVDVVPWAPRMDLWFIANKARGTLPSGCTPDMNTVDIARWLGVACHAVRADYTQSREPDDLMLHGLGLDNHPDYPFHIEVTNLRTDFKTDGENFYTAIETPAGPVTFHLVITEQMKREGNSLPFVKSFPIESADEIKAVASLFDHIRVVPKPDAYEQFRRRIGDSGVAVANGVVASSPVHLMLHNLFAMDQFYYLYHDGPNALYDLASPIERVYNDILEAIMMSSAEMFVWGGNYDRDLTWPPFFKKEILPWLQKVVTRAHAEGKLVVTHTDGENSELLPLYVDAGFDVAESVCPAPMTMLSLKEILKELNGSVTTWGGIPAVGLLPDSMSRKEFQKMLDRTEKDIQASAEAAGGNTRLVLGVSDNVPPDADLTRLHKITERFTQ